MVVAKTAEEIAKYAPDAVGKAVTLLTPELKNSLTQTHTVDIKPATTDSAASLYHKVTVKTEDNNVWDYHEFPKLLSDEDKERYEWFCAGFLFYYDHIVRNDAVNHIIYFAWEDKKVTIHMLPPPIITPHGIACANGQTDPPKPPPPPPPPTLI